MFEKPAILGGKPKFAQKIPITRPTIINQTGLLSNLKMILDSGMLTNHNYVALFEKKCAQYLGVKHVIAVSSCTTGLMLVLKCLRLSGEVLVPSFTFSATVHSIVWNGLKPVFVDCQPDTFNLSASQIKSKITPETCAIIGVHVFGNPCAVEELEKISGEFNLPLIFDAAHAFGGQYHNRKMVGNGGIAEVFSLSPTKLLTAGEGGLITTNDQNLAEKLRLARNYGNTADYDCPFPGLNGRMTEFNAALGLANLEQFDEIVQNRLLCVSSYQKALEDIPGLRFQKTLPGSKNVFKDLGVYVNPQDFGLTRNDLCTFLEHENIDIRKYFYPPTHKLSTYTSPKTKDEPVLTVTEELSQKIICLPLFSHMSLELVEKIAHCIRTAYKFRKEIKNRLAW